MQFSCLPVQTDNVFRWSTCATVTVTLATLATNITALRSRRLRFSSDADIVRLINARIIIISHSFIIHSFCCFIYVFLRFILLALYVLDTY